MILVYNCPKEELKREVEPGIEGRGKDELQDFASKPVIFVLGVLIKDEDLQRCCFASGSCVLSPQVVQAVEREHSVAALYKALVSPTCQREIYSERR